MTLKNSNPQFMFMDLTLIDPDPGHVRQSINEEALKGLISAIQKMGIIHPLIVRPANNGRYGIVAGERRRLAALQAGETKVPVLICSVTDEEALEIRVFENIGLGVRSALEPRDMAVAIQAIAERFSSTDEAAQYFGRSPAWLTQATAAANLSDKVTALLDAGKITSTSAAVQLDKISKKDEAKAEAIFGQIEQLAEGEKVSKKDVDNALSDEGSQLKRKIEPPATIQDAAALVPQERPADDVAPASTVPPASSSELVEQSHQRTVTGSRINPSKVKLVADLLGLSEDDEEALLAKLIDEFLALKGES